MFTAVSMARPLPSAAPALRITSSVDRSARPHARPSASCRATVMAGSLPPLTFTSGGSATPCLDIWLKLHTVLVSSWGPNWRSMPSAQRASALSSSGCRRGRGPQRRTLRRRWAQAARRRAPLRHECVLRSGDGTARAHVVHCSGCGQGAWQRSVVSSRAVPRLLAASPQVSHQCWSAHAACWTRSAAPRCLQAGAQQTGRTPTVIPRGLQLQTRS